MTLSERDQVYVEHMLECINLLPFFIRYQSDIWTSINAVRELGLTATHVTKKLRLSQPAVSIAVKRSEEIAPEGKYRIKKVL